MIGFFPKIYEDELIFSLIARYHTRTGYVRYRFTVDDIYLHRTVKPSIEFVNAYTDDAMSWLTKEMPWSEMIEQHTMLPNYIRFLPKERKLKAFNAMLECNGNYNNLIYIPNIGKRYLRYCPCCSKEDREKYGETYWHRKHQIGKIDICPKHRCYLESTDISMAGRETPMLYDAESVVPEDSEVAMCEDDRQIEFAEYVLSVFDAPLDLDNNQSVGAFLSSRLSDAYRKSGLIRNLDELYSEYVSFFDGFETMSMPQMQKVFNGSLRESYYVSQLAFFEKISVDELAHLPKENNCSEIEELYRKLAVRLDVEYDLVSRIGEEILKYNYEHNRVHRKTGKMAIDYSRLDSEMLPEVKKTVKQILCDDGRPQKVSLAKIEKLLALPQKRILNMPKCREYILEHTESQPEFWARESCWAIYKMIDEEQTLNWVHIRRLTNMKPRDFAKAIPCITDPQIKEIAERIVTEIQV